MINTYDKTFKGPLNTAQSKNLYSFPKEERFKKTKQLQCKKSYYDWDGPKTARSTTFGFGKRSSLTSQQIRPSPAQYDSNSPSKLKKGFTFSNYKKISFVDESASKVSSNPGPGKYEKTFFEKTYSFSMRSKYEDPLHRHKNVKILRFRNLDLVNTMQPMVLVGEASIINQNIRVPAAEKSEENCDLDPTKLCLQVQENVDKDQLALDPVGSYFNSRIESKRIRSFAGPNRDKLFLVGENPGPGTYYIFEEFGSK